MVLDTNLITYVFSPSKSTHGVSDVHLLTNPPTLDASYHLLHSAHPDHYAIFLAAPSDPPGEIVYGEVQVPGGLEVGKGEKVPSTIPEDFQRFPGVKGYTDGEAIILHQPEEIIFVGDNVCRLGFRFDWTFEWQDKKFKWSRDCIAGIMKSMSLSYIPDKAYKDDPPITLALFSAAPSITLLDYNFPRIGIEDIKGFEVIIILFAALFIDVLKSTAVEGTGISAFDVKKETQRLQKLESKAEEKARKQRAEEIDRETERLRKLAEQEYRESKQRDEEIRRETERLRKMEGWYGEKPPPLPQRPGQPQQPKLKKSWWGGNNNNSRDREGLWGGGGGYQGGPNYSDTSARLMGYQY